MLIKSNKPIQIGCLAKIQFQGMNGPKYTHFQGEVVGIKKGIATIKVEKITSKTKDSQYRVKNKYKEFKYPIGRLQRVRDVKDNWWNRFIYRKRILHHIGKPLLSNRGF